MKTVLFVCLGNICRSPMAEAVFRGMVYDAGLSEEIKADSCGTSGWHVGEPPHQGVRKMLNRHGISYADIYSSKLSKAHFSADYIIAMDEDNLRDILALKPAGSQAEIRLLSFFADKDGRKWVSVPDPWYTGDFEETYRLVAEGCANLLEHIVKSQE